MKLLVIGIDGGTKRVLDHMPMPFTHSLFEKSTSKELKEDLISRGWAEILTGEHASRTKAFYLFPFTDKSYRFNRSYSMNDMIKNDSVVPIWRSLNQKGVKVGILNVPTTGPAPKVDGFIVAGGGGGLKATKSVSPAMIHPPESVEVLDRNGYVFDVRLSPDRTFSSFLDSIKDAQERQKNAFLELCSRFKPDFGFHCFRVTTEIQYLAMSEIENYIEEVQNARRDRRPAKANNKAQEKIIEHYVHMDNSIRQLFENSNPENFIFVADHSTAPLKKEINLDIFLENSGLLKRTNAIGVKLNRLAYIFEKLQNRYLAKLGLVKKWPMYRVPSTKFIRSKTSAFGTVFDTGNFGGIYINDQNRFGGPVSTKEIGPLVKRICVLFNESAYSKNLDLSARPFAENFPDAEHRDLMPDIEIVKDDTVFVTCRKDRFVVDSEGYMPLSESLSGIKYPHSGVKGSNPLFVYSNELETCIKNDDPNDLRLAYRMINRFFSKTESLSNTTTERSQEAQRVKPRTVIASEDT